jgi:hypothetical protein
MIGGPICWSFNQVRDLHKLEGFDHIYIGDGEEAIASLLDDIRLGRQVERVIENKARFEINKARPMYRPLMDETIYRYYGAVLEVSRGCPFLCEFCDIRILPNNNRPHNKSAKLIVRRSSIFAIWASNRSCSPATISSESRFGPSRWSTRCSSGRHAPVIGRASTPG